MRYVLALFDAPYPLQQALRALAAAGVSPADITVIARNPASQAKASTSTPAGIRRADASAGHVGLVAPELAGDLRQLGVPADDAAGYAAGVARGGSLVVVRSPTLAAAGVAALLGIGAPDLDTYRARWQANPQLSYAFTTHPGPTDG